MKREVEVTSSVRMEGDEKANSISTLVRFSCAGEHTSHAFGRANPRTTAAAKKRTNERTNEQTNSTVVAAMLMKKAGHYLISTNQISRLYVCRRVVVVVLVAAAEAVCCGAALHGRAALAARPELVQLAPFLTLQKNIIIIIMIIMSALRAGRSRLRFESRRSAFVCR